MGLGSMEGRWEMTRITKESRSELMHLHLNSMLLLLSKALVTFKPNISRIFPVNRKVVSESGQKKGYYAAVTRESENGRRRRLAGISC